ncbi:hypothetical protein STCU_11599 [Strigomonas culicis]|uniref:Uncharacterized protein n=1 Tax=Strigomonas culicis TaxID=28005 RepID=S9UMW5_9TRYP|nr:hypothetical protein STCU_11599 [Strigomonas culicis]|eukprot:EPY16031.1 hypothetical protein STCU_11599 [Strigomonas culicis]
MPFVTQQMVRFPFAPRPWRFFFVLRAVLFFFGSSVSPSCLYVSSVEEMLMRIFFFVSVANDVSDALTHCTTNLSKSDMFGFCYFCLLICF